MQLDRKCGLMRCTVHVHRNLLAPASERLHEEVPADYNDMVYTVTPKEIETRRRQSPGTPWCAVVPRGSLAPRPKRSAWGMTSA